MTLWIRGPKNKGKRGFASAPEKKWDGKFFGTKFSGWIFEGERKVFSSSVDLMWGQFLGDETYQMIVEIVFSSASRRLSNCCLRVPSSFSFFRLFRHVYWVFSRTFGKTWQPKFPAGPPRKT